MIGQFTFACPFHRSPTLEEVGRCNDDWGLDALTPFRQRQRQQIKMLLPNLRTVILIIALVYYNSIILVLAKEQQHSFTPQELQRFDLSPTAALAEHRRQRRLSLESQQQQQQQQPKRRRLQIPNDWLHPYVNAIYATLQPLPPLTTTGINPTNNNNAMNYSFPLQDDDDDFSPAVKEFHAFRHYSRYERLHQQQQPPQGEELQWNPPTHDEFQWNTIYYNDGTIDGTNDVDEYDTNDSHGLKHNKTTTTTLRPGGRRHLEFSFASSSSSSSLYGGQFNQYQAVPLSQGYGTHYVNLWVGSPTPQRQSVIVDTGSHFTAFPCTGCHKCGAEHHTDPHFNPTQSESFHVLQCKECIASGTECDNSIRPEEQTCRFTQSYTEGSSWQAYQARDVVYSGGQDVLQAANPLDHQMAIPFFFGCLTSETGLFVTQLADGIMGMSAHETTLVKQMYNAGKLEHNMFAMCFRRELGTSKRGVSAGSMTLGGVSSSLDTSPMVYAKNVQPYGWFTVHVKGIYIAKNGGTSFAFNQKDMGDKTYRDSEKEEEDTDTQSSNFNDILKVPVDIAEVNSGKGVIVDSGTTDTYLNIKAAKSFAKIWKEVTGMEYTHSYIYLSRSQLRRLPTILIQCQAAGGNGGGTASTTADSSSSPYFVGEVGELDPTSPHDLLIAIPAAHYMEYSPTLKLYTSRVYFTETQGGVLGANAMQGHNVAFDWENGRVGFAQSSCAYDVSNKTNQNADSISENKGYARDCHLSPTPAALTTECMDTVDVRLCLETDDPTNVALMGTETWTRLVETPGTSNGLSCVQAAQLDQQRYSRSSTSSETAGSNMDNGATTGDSSLLPSQFSCPGEGLCLEYRPCEVPCPKALEYHKREKQKQQNEKALPSSGDPTMARGTITPEASTTTGEYCGDSFWSACDTSCVQSRIVSAWGHGDHNYNDDKNVDNSSGKNSVCVEVSRQTRPCHIDACGRSDPCRVPFLVHAIFALKGGVAEKWTPQSLDLFQRALFHNAHNLDPFRKQPEQRLFQPLFLPGDVDVMSVRPWRRDADEKDDVVGQNDKAESSITVQSKGGEESSSDTIAGLELVVQISIFNAKTHTIPQIERHHPSGHNDKEEDASLRTINGDDTPSRSPNLRSLKKSPRRQSFVHEELIPSTGPPPIWATRNNTGSNEASDFSPSMPAQTTTIDNDEWQHLDNGRYLLQEIGDMVRNMTIFQRIRTAPESTCNEADLYPLAKDAMSLATSILQQSDFVENLMDTIGKLEAAEVEPPGKGKTGGTATVSPFLLVYKNEMNKNASHLVSAWTVGTQVYDSEINYFGPMAATPYLLFLRVCYEASVIFLIFSVGSVVFQTLSNYLSNSRATQQSKSKSSVTITVHTWMRRMHNSCCSTPWKLRSLVHFFKKSARTLFSWMLRRTPSRHPYYSYQPIGGQEDDPKDDHILDEYFKGVTTSGGTGSTSYEDFDGDIDDDDSSHTGKIMISLLRPASSFKGTRHSKKEDGIYEIELTSSHSFSDIHSERRNSTTKRRNSLPLQNVAPTTIPNTMSG